MKLSRGSLKKMKVGVLPGCVIVPGTTNLYTHPNFKGVLLRPVASPVDVVGLNGAMFGIPTSVAVPDPATMAFNIQAGAMVGYAGSTWIDVVNGKEDWAVCATPLTPGYEDNKIIATEVAGVLRYPNDGIMRLFRHSLNRPTKTVLRSLLTGGSDAALDDAAIEKICPYVMVMEIVTGATDGFMTRGVVGTARWHKHAAQPSADGATGYLSTSVKLPKVGALMAHNRERIKLEFPGDVHEDYDAVFDQVLMAFAERDELPTLTFWTDVNDGSFGVPAFTPVIDPLSPNENSFVDAPLESWLTASDAGDPSVAGKKWLYQQFPGHPVTEGSVVTRLLGSTMLADAKLTATGMADVIDLNMIRRGQSPHLENVQQNVLAKMTIAELVQPSDWTLPVSAVYNPVELMGGKTRQALEQIALGLYDRNWWRSWSRVQWTTAGRHNGTTLAALVDKFVDQLTDAVRDHAQTRMGG